MAHSKSRHKILSGHRNDFCQVLSGVNEILPIDWKRANYVLRERRWPTAGGGIYAHVVNEEIQESCRPFIPTILAYGPPNEISRSVGFFSFSILDERGCSPGNGYSTPVHLNILPDGRRLLKVYGLFLDSSGTYSRYEGRLWLHQFQLFKRPLVYAVVEQFLESFPVGMWDAASQTIKDQALADFHSSVVLRTSLPSRN